MFVTLLPHIEQLNWHSTYDFSKTWLLNVRRATYRQKDSTQGGIPLYICPSEGQWNKYKNRRHYFGVAGGKQRLGRSKLGDVFFDGPFGIGHNVSHAQITDGSSHTFAVGESSHPAVYGMGPGYGTEVGGPSAWMIGGATDPTLDPDTMSYGRLLRTTKNDPNSSLMPLDHPTLSNEVPFSSEHPGITHFVYADGHVDAIADGIDLNVYQALSTHQGEEVIQEH